MIICEQGMAFSLAERQALGIHGLLPARFQTQELQAKHCKANLDRYDDPLTKHVFLVGLQVPNLIYDRILKA